MQTNDELRGWIGRDLVDGEGNRVGKVGEVYFDEQTGQPEWITVKTGLFGRKVSFVPLDGIRSGSEALISPWPIDHIKEAPRCEPDGHLSDEEEAELYEHYGVHDVGTSGTEPMAGTAGTAVAAGERAGRSEDDAMTRSEEELAVERHRERAGSARLRKWVDTEHESVTVPRQREEVRVQREPITDENIDEAMSGPDISEAEHEVPLYEEEVVAQKQTVPKERIRAEKATVTDREQVEADLRKERVGVEGEEAHSRRS